MKKKDIFWNPFMMIITVSVNPFWQNQAARPQLGSQLLRRGGIFERNAINLWWVWEKDQLLTLLQNHALIWRLLHHCLLSPPASFVSTKPVITFSPISVAEAPSNGADGGHFSRISHSVNPPPPPQTFATAAWKPKEPPCFFGRSSEDSHTWVSLVRNYLEFTLGSDSQQVTYIVTPFREATREWYMNFEHRNRGPPRYWASVLLNRFGSNIRSQEARSQLMSISQRQRFVREYASQFETH